MRVLILTISDSTFGADRQDTSGEAIQLWCARRDDEVVAHLYVPDESTQISSVLVEWCDSGKTDLIVTTGGTGLAPRDVTPEATLAVIEREVPGISEYIRMNSAMRFPKATLSRGVSGIRGATLIINLPGSTTGVQDGLSSIMPIVDHAIDILTGNTTRHDTPWSNPMVR